MATKRDDLGSGKKKLVDEYRAFLHNLGHHLTSVNIQEIKYLIDLPGGEREHINSSVQLFRSLAEHGIISYDMDGLEDLCEIFRIISRNDLVKKVKDFMKTRESASTNNQSVQSDTTFSPKGNSSTTAQENTPNSKMPPENNLSINSGKGTTPKLKLLGPEAFEKSKKQSTSIEDNSSSNVLKTALTKGGNLAATNKKMSSASATETTKTTPTVNEENISEDINNAEFSPSENLSVHSFKGSSEKLTYAVPNFSAAKEAILNKMSSFAIVDKVNYPMDKDPKGICLIISNETFDTGTELDKREGTEVDVKTIESTFEEFGFIIRIHRDVPVSQKELKKPDILKIIEDLSKEDHSSYDCVIIFLLSHGCEQGIYGTDGKCLNMNKIFEPFKNCSSLSGKPKIFFGQFCRGNVEAKDVSDGPMVHSFQMVNHPKEADIYIGYATPPGYVSFRSLTYGSWYISKLCKVFLERAEYDDLKTMMTQVNGEVREAFTKQGCRQVSYEVSTLTKHARLKPVKR